MLEKGVGSVRMVEAVTIMMVMNLPGDSTQSQSQSWMLVLAGGMMVMRVMVMMRVIQ